MMASTTPLAFVVAVNWIVVDSLAFAIPTNSSELRRTFSFFCKRRSVLSIERIGESELGLYPLPYHGNAAEDGRKGAWVMDREAAWAREASDAVNFNRSLRLQNQRHDAGAFNRNVLYNLSRRSDTSVQPFNVVPIESSGHCHLDKIRISEFPWSGKGRVKKRVSFERTLQWDVEIRVVKWEIGKARPGILAEFLGRWNSGPWERQ